jgi:hypothetical protein
MRLRLLAAASLIVLAGCASSSPSPSDSSPPSASPPSASPSPSSQTITGVVSAGVEPHCLILRDAAGSHSLYFHDEALRSSVPAGARVTLVGHPEPGMMTTCQQGEPFIVTAVRKN